MSTEFPAPGPGAGINSQIEINRAIYMDERSYRRRPALARLSEEMTGLIVKLGEAARDSLAQTC